MTKELRANLIFAGILVLLIGPGYFILMKKKLSGPSDPNYLPEPVPDSVAYIHPPPVDPRLPRKEPPEARSWVNKVIQERFNQNATVLLDPTRKAPLLSNNFQSQILLLDQTDSGKTRCVILIWNEKVSSAKVKFVSRTGTTSDADVDSSNLDIPKDVLHALQQVGYPYPLSRSLMIVATDSSIRQDDLSQVNLTTIQSDKKATQETIPLELRLP